MAKLSPLLAEWGTMKFLITEMALCLLAASILGLIIGWLCKAAFARDKLVLRERAWQNKYSDMEQEYSAQTESAQQEVRMMKSRVESLDAKNKSLGSSLDTNKSAVHKAHIEVQRLSNKQKETHSRLEKIIAEKDREITNLVKASTKGKDTAPRPYGFSSNKPPETNPTQPQSPARNRNRATSAADPTPTARGVGGAGGTPGIAHTDDGSFKPGTQQPFDDSDVFDRTQVLDHGHDGMIETGRYSSDGLANKQGLDTTSSFEAPAYGDPSNDLTADATQAPRQNYRDSTSQDGQSVPANDGRNNPASTAQYHPSQDATGAHTDKSTTKPRKRSLWERVKGSGKKDT